MLPKSFILSFALAIGFFGQIGFVLANETIAEDGLLQDLEKIYVVDSYDPTSFPWTQQIFDGIEAGLKENGHVIGQNVSIKRFTLDAYKNKSKASRDKAAATILDALKAEPPHYLICTDDDAIRWVCLEHSLDIPTILNGINGDPSRYLHVGKIKSLQKPAHHITGIYQTSYFGQSLQLLKLILPEASRIAVFTDETTTGLALLNSLKVMDQSQLALRWSKTLMSSQLADWISAINEFQDQQLVDAVLILSSNALHDSQGQLMSMSESLAEFQLHSRLPEIGSWEFQVEAGMMLSAADSGFQQGYLSALYLDQIAKGKMPGDLPFISPSSGIPAINVSRAKQLGLGIPQSLVNTIIESGVAFQ